MPSGTIARRDDAVLVVVDIQDRLSAIMPDRERVLFATDKLLRTAVLVGVPAIATRQYPKGLGDLDPGVAESIARAKRDGASITLADKITFDCFGEASFGEALVSSRRRQLLLVGMETHICVNQTALSGLAEQFDVHVVADACCARDASSHEIALERMRAAGAVVTTSESVMYELVGAAATDEFRTLLGIVKG
jgi:nicotinamidase-related amidase